MKKCRGSPKSLLPNPRYVSYKLMEDKFVMDPKVSHLFTQFGQVRFNDKFTKDDQNAVS